MLKVIPAVLVSWAFCANAFADDCMKLDKNPKWIEGMNVLSVHMAAKNWDEALQTAQELSAICERSPVLNYAMGRIYREKGDNQKTLFHMRQATLSTEEFAVKGKMLEQMWFERYEAEHPEARAESIAARQKDIEDRDAEIARLRDLERQTHDQAMAARVDEKAGSIAEKTHYAAGLWTGVGVAAAGLILTGIGTWFYFDVKNDGVEYDDDKAKYSASGSYATSWALIGAGIAATVAGSAVAGVMGYFYSHADDADAPVSFNISPMSANLTVNF